MMAEVHLSAEQRRALRLLIYARQGLTEATLVQVYGFTSELLTELVHLRLAELATGTARAGSRTIEVTRVKISDARRRAINIRTIDRHRLASVGSLVLACTVRHAPAWRRQHR